MVNKARLCEMVRSRHYLGWTECGLRISDFGFRSADFQSTQKRETKLAIRIPHSAIRNPHSFRAFYTSVTRLAELSLCPA
jgi:hypothetical protein